MSFERYYQKVVAANPGFGDKDVTIRIASDMFELALRRAYKAGLQDAANTVKAAEAFKKVGRSDSSSFFESMFGKGF